MQNNNENQNQTFVPANYTIRVIFLDGTILEQNHHSLKHMVKFALQIAEQNSIIPLKVIFPSTGKLLYFDDELFKEFTNGKIAQSELIEVTQCDGLYRNKESLRLKSNQIIDEGALWKKDKDKLILIDNDDYISTLFDDKDFTEI